MKVIGALMLAAAVVAALLVFGNFGRSGTPANVGMAVELLSVILSFSTVGAVLFAGGSIIEAIREKKPD